MNIIRDKTYRGITVPNTIIKTVWFDIPLKKVF